MSWLIVGLGNPGLQYRDSRHNIGFQILDHLPFNLSWREKFKGELATLSYGEERVFFLRPLTYMNLSGESVGPCAHFFKIPPSHILVLYDDLDLPFGTLRMRTQGGTGGHNGLKSLTKHLGTGEFKRIKMGIGRPQGGREQVSHYVLSPFSPEERAWLDDFLQMGAEAVEAVLKDGFEKAAGQFSQKRVIP